MYELNFEFTPNNTIKIESDRNYFYPQGSFSIEKMFLKKIESSNNYAEWFDSILGCFSGNVTLIPDTNFLLRCYYSSDLKQISEKNKNKISFSLSRLTLLEIEWQIDVLSQKIESPKKANDKTKEQEIEKDKARKRLKLQAIGEVAEIIKDGANIIRISD